MRCAPLKVKVPLQIKVPLKGKVYSRYLGDLIEGFTLLLLLRLRYLVRLRYLRYLGDLIEGFTLLVLALGTLT